MMHESYDIKLVNMYLEINRVERRLETELISLRIETRVGICEQDNNKQFYLDKLFLFFCHLVAINDQLIIPITTDVRRKCAPVL